MHAKSSFSLQKRQKSQKEPSCADLAKHARQRLVILIRSNEHEGRAEGDLRTKRQSEEGLP